ncbi:sn-1-specific diacylglycerol lipase ABHD11-like [Anticarsia gemmatalis]|uniref:sn-1-specific diacylglycerol lipase ABHD11-like n=1 Tax=Anticarsia gemmatalis TaxID=129554 RepID=UPI003F769D80
MEYLFNLIPSLFLRQVVPRSMIQFRTVVSLSYKILGDGTSDPPKPPVFMFHNIVGNKFQWEGIGKTILNITRRTVVAVDLRNHGNSPHANSHKYTDQASDVLQLFDKLGVQQASLIGHSMGGRTAMCVALMAPLKVAGLLVVDISPISTPPHFTEFVPNLLAAMKAVDFKKPRLVSIARSEARGQLKLIIKDEFLMKVVLSNVKLKEDGTIGWICNLDGLIKNLKHWTTFPTNFKGKAYNGPTLFIGGQLSDYILPEDLHDIRLLFPNAIITYVPKTKHYVHIDDPKTFLELTISFLKTHYYHDPKPIIK